MVRIFPYSAMQFTSFELYKKYLPVLLGTEPNNHVVKFMSGSLAGMTAVIFTFPLDLIRCAARVKTLEWLCNGVLFRRTRLAFQTKENRRYHGIFDAMKKIAKEVSKLLLPTTFSV